jgi:hypothetical protein
MEMGTGNKGLSMEMGTGNKGLSDGGVPRSSCTQSKLASVA